MNRVTHTYTVLLSDHGVTTPLGWDCCLLWVRAQPNTLRMAGTAANQVPHLRPRRSPSPLVPAHSSSSWWTSAHPTPLLLVSDVVSASLGHRPPGRLHEY